MASGKTVPVSLRVPSSMDSFFEMVSTKTIEVEGKRLVIKKPKTDLYLQALEFAIENAESWLRSKPKVE